MAWVRGHYRRTARGYVRVRAHHRSSPGGELAAIILGVLIAVGYGIYWVVTQVAAIVAANLPIIAGTISAGIGLVAIIYFWRYLRTNSRAKRLKTFTDTLEAVIKDQNSKIEQWTRLEELKKELEALPDDLQQQMPRIYRHLVSMVVDDGRVTPGELATLQAAERVLTLSSKEISSARHEGFMAVYRDAIADGVLTEDEEQSLKQVRDALNIPSSTINEELSMINELKAARQVRESLPNMVQPPVKLKKGEQCYYSTSSTEQKLKSTRSSSQRTFEPIRSGTLFITDQRLLFVAEGTTTIKHADILDLTVDSKNKLLVVTKDGRKTPYYFGTPEPFVTAAHLEKASFIVQTE